MKGVVPTELALSTTPVLWTRDKSETGHGYTITPVSQMYSNRIYNN